MIAEIFLSLILVMTSKAKIQCMNENGKPVDWFILYKFPWNASKNKQAKSGQNYGFITSETLQKGWSFSNTSIGDSSSFPAQTLSPMYDKDVKNLIYMLYNDDQPEGESDSKKGHTKGVAVFDKETGFWLIHSVPKFPPKSGKKYDYPSTAMKFGQTFLCISVKTSSYGELVGKQLLYNEPFVFDSNVPAWAKTNYPQLVQVANKENFKGGSEYFNVAPISTIKGVKFTSFAKMGKYGKDLYLGMVAPNLKSDLIVQSWQNGMGGKMNAICNGTYKVQNIVQLNFKQKPDEQNVNFESRNDHSKWAMTSESSNSNTKQVCIGDVNRMYSQTYRGGGTVCLKNANVWKAFNELVKETEPCSLTKKMAKAAQARSNVKSKSSKKKSKSKAKPKAKPNAKSKSKKKKKSKS